MIQGEAILQDSTVLEANIIYPTDVRLVHAALEKMRQFVTKRNSSLWWDHEEAGTLFRSYNLEKKADSQFYLRELTEKIFAPALEKLKEFIPSSEEKEKESFLSKEHDFLAMLLLFEEQNQQKLEGVIHISNRIVSLDDLDARPIKKGKNSIACEECSHLWRGEVAIAFL